MAICFRRILRNYSSLSYPSVRSQYALLEQKNSPTFNTAIEVNQDDLFPRLIVDKSSCRLKKAVQHEVAKEKKKDIWRNELAFLGNDLYCDKLYLSSIFQKEIIHCVKECKAYKEREPQKYDSSLEQPTASQLEEVQEKLCNDLTMIFEKPLDHNIYHEGMVFENNILGTRTIGIKNYLKQIAFLKMYVSIIFSSAKFQILKITTHNEDGTIRVRWRIKGIPGIKVIILFWKQKVWRQKANIETEDGWLDGFSIFYVKGDGLVHKHVASKLMPDDKSRFLSVKSTLAAKVALITGIISHDFSPASLPEMKCGTQCKEKQSS